MIAFFGAVPIETTTHQQAAVTAFVLVVALALVASLGGLIRRVVGRRGRDFVHADNGVCGHCGYNLRGLPSTICPECGSDTAVVGVRRPSRKQGTGRWILCALWIALLLVFNLTFRVEIESYFLRLVWGVEYRHLGGMITFDRSEGREAMLLRQLLIAALIAGGLTVILFASRRSSRRAPADEYRN